MAVCVGFEDSMVRNRLMDSINRHFGGSWFTLTRWNDRPKRTHAEVMAAFDRAIEEHTTKPKGE